MMLCFFGRIFGDDGIQFNSIQFNGVEVGARTPWTLLPSHKGCNRSTGSWQQHSLNFAWVTVRASLMGLRTAV
jgi:hypothetical protein